MRKFHRFSFIACAASQCAHCIDIISLRPHAGAFSPAIGSALHLRATPHGRVKSVRNRRRDCDFGRTPDQHKLPSACGLRGLVRECRATRDVQNMHTPKLAHVRQCGAVLRGVRMTLDKWVMIFVRVSASLFVEKLRARATITPVQLASVNDCLMDTQIAR